MPTFPPIATPYLVIGIPPAAVAPQHSITTATAPKRNSTPAPARAVAKAVALPAQTVPATPIRTPRTSPITAQLLPVGTRSPRTRAPAAAAAAARALPRRRRADRRPWTPPRRKAKERALLFLSRPQPRLSRLRSESASWPDITALARQNPRAKSDSPSLLSKRRHPYCARSGRNGPWP